MAALMMLVTMLQATGWVVHRPVPRLQQCELLIIHLRHFSAITARAFISRCQAPGAAINLTTNPKYLMKIARQILADNLKVITRTLAIMVVRVIAEAIGWIFT